DVAQIFLGNPRSWAEATPLKVNEKGSDADAKHLPHWVHATYLINVCSENPTVRQRSIKALAGTLAAAIQSGSRGVVVHAGQGASQNVGDTLEHWKAA